MTREEAIRVLKADYCGNRIVCELHPDQCNREDCEIWLAITALQAQEHSTNLAEVGTDCISRQAVLDLIEMSMNDLEYDDENEELQYAIRSLPSAKLNFDMTTKIDKAYDDGYQAGYLQAKHDWGDKDE